MLNTLSRRDKVLAVDEISWIDSLVYCNILHLIYVNECETITLVLLVRRYRDIFLALLQNGLGRFEFFQQFPGMIEASSF